MSGETQDITTLGLKVDATQPAAAAQVLDRLAESSKKAGTEADNFVKSVERQAATLGKSRSQIIQLDAANMGLSKSQMESVRSATAAMEAYDAQQAVMSRLNLTHAALAVTVAGALVGAFLKLIGVMKESLDLAGQSEAGWKRLQAAMMATGNAAGLTLKDIHALAEQISSKTFFDDDAVVKAAGTMMVYRNVQGDTFKQAIKLSADLAAMYGGDLSDAARQLGRALDSPTQNLTLLERQYARLSPAVIDRIKSLEAEGRLEEAQALVLKELQARYGGIAEQMNTGVVAAQKNVKREWEDLLKDFAKSSSILNTSEEALNTLTTVLKSLREALRLMKDDNESFGEGGYVGFMIKGMEKAITTAFPQLQTVLKIMQLTSAALKEVKASGNANAGNSDALAALSKTFGDEHASVSADHQKYIETLDASYKAYQNLNQALSQTASDQQKEQDAVKQLRDWWGKLAGQDLKDAIEKYGSLDGAIKKLLAGMPTAKKAQEEFNAAIEAATRVVAQAFGDNPDYEKNLKALDTALKAGKISATEYGFAFEYLFMTQNSAGIAMQKVMDQSKQIQKQLDQQSASDIAQQTQEYEKQAQALEDQAANLKGGAGAAIEAKIAMLEYDRSINDTGDSESAYVKQLDAQIAALRRSQSAIQAITQERRKQLQVEEQIQHLQKLSQGISNDAQTIGSILADGFGRAGSALGGLTKALGDFGSSQAQIAADFQRNMSDAAKSTDPMGAAIEAIQQKSADSAKAGVKMYADMAAAAKGFFSQNSTGYRILDGLEKAYRIMQIAESTKSFMVQMEQVLGITAAKKAGDSDALTSLVGYIAKAIPLRQAEGQANAVTGVANQANGDPYSAFFRIAAMAAIMAGLGFVVGGISGGGSGGPRGSTPDFMNNQGTGTVLGDTSGKSDSIVNALQILRDNSSDDLHYTSQMLTSLRAIESSMKGLASMAARLGLTGQGVKLPDSGSGNTFSVSSAGVIIGQHLSGSSEHAVFGGQTVQQLTSNPYAQQFTGVERTHSGMFGSSYSAINYDYASLAQEFTHQIALAATNMRDALASALNVLTGGNHSIEAIKDALNKLNVDVTTINFADLKGADIQTAIEQAFSAIGDNMAQGVISELTGTNGLFASDNLDKLTEFQQVGEGAFQTVIRVASGVEKANAQLSQWGFTQEQIVKWQDIMNKQGDVSTEIMRQTVVAFETSADGAVSGFGKIIAATDKTGDDFVQLYEKLRNVQALLEQSAVSASSLSQAMLDGAGGINKLTQGLQVYAGLLPAQQTATVLLQQVGRQFSAIGLTMPTSVEGLKQMIGYFESIGNEEMVGRILALVPAWNDAENAARNAADNARDAWLSVQDAIAKLQGGTDLQSQTRHLSALVSSFEANNAWSSGMTPQELVQQLMTITQDQFTNYSEADQKLITAILSLAGTIQDNTKAQQSSGTFGPTDVYAVRDQLLSSFDKKYGPLISGESGYSSQFGLHSNLLQDQIGSWQARMNEILTQPGTYTGGAFTPGPEYYGLQAAIEKAHEQLGGLSQDLARVTILESQYGQSIGDQVFDLEKWYAQQQSLLAGNNDALTALEKQYQDKRNQIISGGTSDGLQQIRDSIQKWRQSLLLSDSSPLTPQERLNAALQQYRDTYSAAQGGDQNAMQNYQQIAQSLLQEEQSFYGRASTQYQAIFQQILKDSGGLAGIDPNADPVLDATKQVASTISAQTTTLSARLEVLSSKLDTLANAVTSGAQLQANATQQSTERLIDSGVAAR